MSWRFRSPIGRRPSRAICKGVRSAILSGSVCLKLWPDVLRHELFKHRVERLIGPGRVTPGSGIAPRRNLSEQALGLSASGGRRQFAMLPNRDTPRSSAAPSKAILHEINLAPSRRHLETEAGQFSIPQVAVPLAGPGSVYSAFSDVPGSNPGGLTTCSILTCRQGRQAGEHRWRSQTRVSPLFARAPRPGTRSSAWPWLEAPAR